MVGLCMAGLGAFFGACLRGVLSDVFNREEVTFSYGTFLANIIGSFLGGLFLALAKEASLSPVSQTLIITGFCGGLTTFSTFSLEVYQLFFDRKDKQAFAYWLVSLVVCMLVATLGFYLAPLMTR